MLTFPGMREHAQCSFIFRQPGHLPRTRHTFTDPCQPPPQCPGHSSSLFPKSQFLLWESEDNEHCQVNRKARPPPNWAILENSSAEAPGASVYSRHRGPGDPWGAGGTEMPAVREHTVPVGDPHFSSGFVSLPDQGNTLRGLLNMLIQAVDCTKTGKQTSDMVFSESESGEGLVCCDLHSSLMRWTLPASKVRCLLPCKEKGDCQSRKKQDNNYTHSISQV